MPKGFKQRRPSAYADICLRLRSSFKQILPGRPHVSQPSVPNPRFGYVELNRFLYFNRLFARISGVDGAIVECGTGRGRGLLTLLTLARNEDRARMVWGFDSFAGFPSPSPQDLNVDGSNRRHVQRGRLNNTTVDGVLEMLQRNGFDRDYLETHLRLVPGFFNGSLSAFWNCEPEASIALLHIDADLYQSYLDVLNMLWPKVAAGGIVAFDEYGDSVKYPGARLAVDEFLSGVSPLPVVRSDALTGKCYVVK